MLKTAMQNAHTSGGKPSILMTGPFNKTKVSGFAGIAAQRYMAQRMHQLQLLVRLTCICQILEV